MYRTLLRITVLLLFISVKSYSQCNLSNNLLAGPNAAFAYPTNVDAEKAFDIGANSLTTAWTVSPSSGDFTAIGVNLGTQHKFCSVHLKFDPSNFPSHFVISGSDNWGAFQPMAEILQNTQSERDVALTDIGLATIIQLVIYDGPTHVYSVIDFQAFETSANTAPTVDITSPTSTGVYYANQQIALTVDAMDINGGSVSKVDYYLDNGTTPIATSTTSPFSANWTTPTVGSHTIKAIATDNQNLASSADVITINVLAAPAYMKNWTLTGNNLSNSNSGTVFIGPPPTTPATIADAKLLVYGNMYAQKLTVKASWADYVFNSDYNLRPLSEVENYISKHKHLPDVPSAKQIEEKGVSVGDNQAILLKKIEELTLYLIEQNKSLTEQNKKINLLQKRVKQQDKKIQLLKSGK